jgi:hypothetical protein
MQGEPLQKVKAQICTIHTEVYEVCLPFNLTFAIIIGFDYSLTVHKPFDTY